jgi:hypothetical protein
MISSVCGAPLLTGNSLKRMLSSMMMVFCASLFCISLFWSSPSFAYCEEYINDSSESYDLTTICASSIGKPFYRVVQHLYSDGSAQIFSFAPRSRKLLCHSYDIGGQSYENCQNYGVNFFPKTFKGSKFTVTMVELTAASSQMIGDVYSDDNLFQYPELAEFVEIDNCFAVIHNKSEISIGYDEDMIVDMAPCLVQMEMFLAKNKELIR